MNADAKVRHALQDMEDDIYAVEQFARLLTHVAGSPHMIEAACLSALANPLMTIGANLREQFRAAFAAAGGQA